MCASYDSIKKELSAYSQDLVEKKEVIVLTKADMLAPDEIKKAFRKLQEKNKNILLVSVIDDKLLRVFKEQLLKILKSI